MCFRVFECTSGGMFHEVWRLNNILVKKALGSVGEYCTLYKRELAVEDITLTIRS